mmetsp:Transcript_14773/g.21791  ORF Transcript_14773/g.21791 Transcript_14773/m.21791 type:complete len:371 (+) Transcript_14773:91-1203(+)|eukprot:CAMPEP_0194209458 /NCGR_PEP_ID=MMETSP0156-20130528/7580_1 /TAXON_ID=33649 /ORGANISM="Thalassionema nitzschioides, Strain L26-B" /LENGTH=370 /DNA_ID=CAMNT_0038936639 /DNA_START=75 /DNA_END=1187 /DNA_ORIENTATION=+
MYSDLLDVLGNQSSSSGGARRGETEKHVAVSFKAGKMKMELKENGKYWVKPDTRRGEVQLVWASQSLKWEWMDRRDKTVVDSVKIASGGGKFERVDTGNDEERVYLWTNKEAAASTKKWEMYWMQDLVNETEDELVAQVNQYLTNPTDAAPEAENSNNTGSNSIGVVSNSNKGSGNDNSSSNNSQVDALSNILENLGMPETSGNVSESRSAAAPGGILTLADLQGAMAGLPKGSSPGSGIVSSTPLSEVVTPAAITSLLEDDNVKGRLIGLLPDEQRSEQYLEENLRSPQIQQTLRALSQALTPDDEGSLEGYHSVIANFQLDPKDGEASIAVGNPIQAFLDCVLASVKKEKNESTDANNEESKGNDMEE